MINIENAVIVAQATLITLPLKIPTGLNGFSIAYNNHPKYLK
jgi:hypothetical protein